MVKSAGNSAHMNSLMMEPSVTNPLPMEEELDMLRNNQDTRNGVLSGTQNAERTSIMLDAACAHPIAQTVWMTLASPVPRTHITET